MLIIGLFFMRGQHQLLNSFLMSKHLLDNSKPTRFFVVSTHQLNTRARLNDLDWSKILVENNLLTDRMGYL